MMVDGKAYGFLPPDAAVPEAIRERRGRMVGVAAHPPVRGQNYRFVQEKPADNWSYCKAVTRAGSERVSPLVYT